jgi:hypothetical protein
VMVSNEALNGRVNVGFVQNVSWHGASFKR